ncbi:MAG: fluoride efflux transporter CrcB [Alistipes sp.]|jgi:CrcB protein|nr:fluoride efflux transporter CrcB [Alistipes sp.]
MIKEMLFVKEMLAVGLGGFVGSALRYAVGRWLNPGGRFDLGHLLGSGFPWGTLMVNVVGCLLMGLLMGLAGRGNLAGAISPELRLLLTAGFCGGFTTFSAFMGENLSMVRAGEFVPLAIYIAASLLLGFAAVALGWWLTK